MEGKGWKLELGELGSVGFVKAEGGLWGWNVVRVEDRRLK